MKKNNATARLESVSQEELLSALGRNPTDQALEWLGITRRQFTTWARKPDFRAHPALARLIRFKQRMALGELLGKEWDGFYIHGQALEFPNLKRALPAQELRSLWFHIQQVGFHDARAARAEADLSRAEERIETLERDLAFYRRQVRLEGKMGLMLAAMTA